MTAKKPDLEQLLHLAINASLKAGEEIMKIYESDFSFEEKEDRSPLTLADKNAHDVIWDLLRGSDFNILSEEGKNIQYAERNGWDYFWMVDPLDGTKEFIKRNGEFTVNIALIHQQRSILGVIYVPVTKTLYFAAKDIGSYKFQITDMIDDNITGIISQSLKLPVESPVSKFIVVASRSHLSEETEMFIDGLKSTYPSLEFISSGSSIKMCLIAEGKANVYPRFAPTMEWDTAAGQAICESAGKKVIDYKSNKPLLYNKESLLNSWFIAS
ncbi:MAG: putative sulfite synthesis pathway protein [Bacteroidetes bacterium]|jgi:3'(2'), 5'-bisphosphate nucleotidase|nr:putative sulfite synthesis pathway protein [Bacteroidota bacterium]